MGDHTGDGGAIGIGTEGGGFEFFGGDPTGGEQALKALADHYIDRADSGEEVDPDILAAARRTLSDARDPSTPLRHPEIDYTHGDHV